MTPSSSVEWTVAQLREIARRSGLERTYAIGELIIGHFFEGSPELWRDRRRGKRNSICRLAQRSDCPFGKSALNEAVAVYVALVALPRVRTFEHVSASHVASVLRLDPDQQEPMLARAERERWSVRELRRRAASMRRAAGERRGRPVLVLEHAELSSLRGSVRRLDIDSARVEALTRLNVDSRVELRTLAGKLVDIGNRLLELGSV